MTISFVNENLSELCLNDLLVSNPSATFFFRVVSDSINDFGILSGDIVFVDRSIEPIVGKLILCTQDDKFVIQKFQIGEEINFWGVITYAIHKI